MINCSYCMREQAKYKVMVQANIVGKDCELEMNVCISCMPIKNYLLKEYECL